MKILMVAIPNHHFFQWVNQLKEAGYEVYWFDIKDAGGIVERINWVKQIKGWRLRWDFPFRHFVKNKFSLVYKWINKCNERNVVKVFEKKIVAIKPDIIHCFEMKLTGIPILNVLEKYKNIPLIYSSWGSDLYFLKENGLNNQEEKLFLDRVNFLITDCKRDFNIATENGFKNKYLGVFPGNGGITIPENNTFDLQKRNVILIKGYDDGVGKAIKVIEALELLALNVLQNLEIIIYSADKIVKDKVRNSKCFETLNVKIFGRNSFISNTDLLQIMGKSIVYIGNSISDGMPNSLLEAMGMGAFPIQSNPGNATEEIITDGKNGFLIHNPLDALEISNLIKNALQNQELRENAMRYNIDFIQEKYNRTTLKKEIVQLYQAIFDK
jgi:glycosyltransferase involved in cell wall biosynthesis